MLLMKETGNSKYKGEYRAIKDKVLNLCKEENIKTIQITSCRDWEGKSTIASNLAYCFSEEGYKTLLIDLNFHKPSLHRKLGVKNQSGISEVLNEEKIGEAVIQELGENLFVIPVGQVSDELKSLKYLSNRSLKKTLENTLINLKENYEKIIIDTPSILEGETADEAKKISSIVDGSILVIKNGTIKTKECLMAKEAVEGIGGTLLGAVLNGVENNI
ncbi:MAG: CpsD/CapB family tyrosine-protein kinase [Clostridium sp.]